MLTEPRQPDLAGGTPSRSTYIGAREASARKSKAVSVTSEKTAEAIWIDCVKRIDRERDESAFRLLFDHFAPRVKGFLMRSGVDAALAEECTQEVMATLWHKAHLFDPSRASVATWVFTIARNRKIDTLRKQRRPEPEDLPWGPEAEPEPVEIVSFQQESEKLGEALAQLPAKQRELIERAYYGDLSHSEIADATGLPLGTIKSRIRLALERLRHTMK
ncbi:MAG: sigma-70 family RNA polymerase sigma factor [Pseudomonadota bacterium]